MKPPLAHAPRGRFFLYSQNSSLWEKDISDRSLWILLLIHQGTWNMFRPTAGHYVSSFEYYEHNDGRILATLSTRINSSTEKCPTSAPHWNSCSYFSTWILLQYPRILSHHLCQHCSAYAPSTNWGDRWPFRLKIQRLQGLRLEARCSHRIWQQWSPSRWL